MLIKISDFLKADAIFMDIKATEKLDVIKELAEKMVAINMVTDRTAFMNALAKRENLESTGIGDGIAIPHARTNAVQNLVLAFARSPEGVDFSAIDGKPSHLIFLIASPEDKKSEYIMALAKLSRLLRKEPIRELLKSAASPNEILNIIKKHEE